MLLGHLKGIRVFQKISNFYNFHHNDAIGNASWSLAYFMFSCICCSAAYKNFTKVYYFYMFFPLVRASIFSHPTIPHRARQYSYYTAALKMILPFYLSTVICSPDLRSWCQGRPGLTSAEAELSWFQYQPSDLVTKCLLPPVWTWAVPLQPTLLKWLYWWAITLTNMFWLLKGYTASTCLLCI